MPGAVHYQLQISKDADFKAPLLDQTLDLPGYRWNELPTVTCYWRVRSIDAEDRRGQWSAPQTIAPSVAAPGLKAPAVNGTVAAGEGPAEFEVSFEASAVLKTYAAELATDAAFASVVAKGQSPTPALKLAMPDPGTYWLRARGTDLGGRDTAPGEPRSIQVVLAAPRLARAVERAVWAAPPPKLVLEWSANALARGYQVEVGKAGAALARLEATRPRLEWAPPGTGTFSWRVAVVDAKGAAGRWSEPATLEVSLAAPALTSPAENQAVRVRQAPADVSVAWAAVAGATRYKVELAADAGFTAGAVAGEVAQPGWQASGLEVGTHSLRVTAFDAAGRASPPSEVRRFSVQVAPPLGAPRVLAPVADAVVPAGARVEVKLESPPEAVSVQVELDGAAPVPYESKAAALGPLAEGDHTLRARALDALGGPGEWSLPVALFAGTPPSARGEVELERASLAADGKSGMRVRVRLFDAKGRPVRGAAPTATATSGTVSSLSEDADGYSARYVVPARLPSSREDPLVIVDRDFRVSATVALHDAASRLGAGARLGWASNFGGLSSPTLSADLTYRTPLFDNHLLVSARASYLGSARVLNVSGAPQPVQVRATVVPVSVTAEYEQPFPAFAAYAGAGPCLSFTSATVDAAYETAPVLGVVGLLGASRALGPGRASAELGFSLGALSTRLVQVRTGAVSFTLGYQVNL